MNQSIATCRNGHPRTESNTYFYFKDGRRIHTCAICRKKTNQERPRLPRKEEPFDSGALRRCQEMKADGFNFLEGVERFGHRMAAEVWGKTARRKAA